MRPGKVLADQRRVPLHVTGHLRQRSENVIEAFRRLAARRQLAVLRYDGF
jgi:hypothetical protein